MLAVLHAAAKGGLSRTQLAAALDVPAERIEAGWAYLDVRPPAGLRVQHFRLVTDNTCASSVERYLQRTDRLSRSASHSARRWPSWPTPSRLAARASTRSAARTATRR